MDHRIIPATRDTMIPDTPEYQLGQNTRDWALSVLGLTGDDRGRVIMAQRGQEYENDGVTPTGRALRTKRPDIPFLVINVLSHGDPVGSDTWYIDGTNDTRIYKGTRTAAIEISGYGLPTAAWLEALTMRYREVEGLALIPRPGMQSVPMPVEEDYIEARYVKEFEAIYGVEFTSPPAADVVDLIDADTTIDAVDADVEQDMT